jgi:hypothetical protein
MTDYITEYLTQGGKITQCPPGNSLRENDGMTPQQIDKQKWAVRMEKQIDKQHYAVKSMQANK